MIRNKLEFATSGLDAIVVDKRDGHIVARNPIVYFAPVCTDGATGTCICAPCAQSREWQC